jgi:hypothetical protein
MANDISTIAASLLKDLYAIPPFTAMRTAAEGGSLLANPEGFLGSAFTTETGAVVGEGQLDGYYRSVLDRIIAELPEGSLEYNYIILTDEFRFIKEKYLLFRSAETTHFFDTLVKEYGDSLTLLDVYRVELEALEDRIHSIDDTFEFISLIDRVYLTVLAAAAAKADEYMREIIRVKIEHYNVMTALRMTQLGKKRELIESLFVTGDLVDTYALEHLEYRDVVAEIGMMIGMKPEQISVTAIETRLLNHEITVINKATFEGVTGARIIQYIEQLRFFIANMKVVFASKAMGLTQEEVMKRFVAYDAI